MQKNIKKAAVLKADVKELRALAATAKVKFIGKKTEDLRKELLKLAVDDTAKKPAKKAAKKAEPAAGEKPAARREPKLIGPDDVKAIEKFDTKKGKVITLRQRGFSIAEIAAAVTLHPTNVSRYIREAGMSTCKDKVPQERIDRIKATIASKKGTTQKVKAAPVKEETKKEAKKPVAKAAKKAEKKHKK